jgi:hypothetical protein
MPPNGGNFMGRPLKTITISVNEFETLKKEFAKVKLRLEVAEHQENLVRQTRNNAFTENRILREQITKLQNQKPVLFVEQNSVPFMPITLLNQFEIVVYRTGYNAPNVYMPQKA